MTLIVNEVRYVPGDKARSRIIAAADSQILRDGKPIAARRKLFDIGGLNGTVSYFGLAEVSATESFEDMLARFVLNHRTRDLEQFALGLKNELERLVDGALLREEASGLHVCGFTSSGLPEFWFVRNIQGIDGARYSGLHETYTLTEELRGQHQKENFDVGSHDFIRPFSMNFANGDLRPFGHAWNLFDGFAAQMEAEGVAAQAVSQAELEKRVQWKMQTIAGFYETVATEPLIGPPIVTKLLSPT